MHGACGNKPVVNSPAANAVAKKDYIIISPSATPVFLYSWISKLYPKGQKACMEANSRHSTVYNYI
jgi:hypothetical protein